MTRLERWRGVAGIVLCAACTAFAATGWDGDKEELCRRVGFTAQSMPSSGTFRCRFTKWRSLATPSIGASDLARRTSDYETKLRNQLTTGSYTPSRAQLQRLQEEFGTSNYQSLLGNPTVRLLMDEWVEREVEAYRARLILQSSSKYEEGQISYTIAPDDRLRVERTWHTRLRGDEPLGAQASRQDVTVITSESLRRYMPDKAAGTIMHGTAHDPGILDGALDWLDPRAAGKPNAFAVDKPDAVTSVATEQTPEGEALRLLVEQEFKPGVGNVFVMWVLPNKGYSLYRYEQYMHGTLKKVKEFGEYVELEPGVWYPKRQRCEIIRAHLPEEILEQLTSGLLSLGAHEVLSGQVIDRSEVCERLVESVEIGGEPPASAFELTFPQGTTIADHTLADGQGRAFQYRVGELAAKSTASAEIDSIVGELPSIEEVVKGDVASVEMSLPDVELPRAGTSTDGPAVASAEGTRGFHWWVLVSCAVFAVVLLVAVFGRRLRRNRRSCGSSDIS